MNKRTLSLSLLLVLATLAVTACGGLNLSTLAQSANQIGNQISSQTSNQTGNQSQPLPVATQVPPVVSGASGDMLAAYQGTLENIYSAVSPSVVNIQVVQKVSAGNSSSDSQQLPGFPFFSNPQGQQPHDQFQGALGSGFVWDQQGHIVTNNHVVNGADQITVTFSDGNILPAKLVGTDPDSDLAVIQVDSSAHQLQPITLGDSAAVKVGQMAVAIGNPYGLEGTMTTGIISALGRSLPSTENSAQSYTIPDIIQTDAPINPGNSGGVLLNADAQVIGVTSAIESASGANSGIGFAIPSAIVNNVVPALINDGKYVHTWLGISGSTLIPDLATAMNLNAAQRGALVEEVMPNSPAEKAGLKGSDKQITINGQNTNVGGDVITAIDNQKVFEMDDLIAYLARDTKVDQKVTLTILRDGKEQNVDVTLAARPTAQERAQANNNNNSNNNNNNNNNNTAPAPSSGIHLGILGIDMVPAIAQQMNLSQDQQGVLIQQVEPGSLADKAGLQAGTQSATVDGQNVMIGGDIITGINGQQVSTIQDLKTALSQLPAGHPLTLTVLRDGKETQVDVQNGQ
jgi:serine protease Do